MAISNSPSPEIIWGPRGPGEDRQLHHCCLTGRVGEREEEEEEEEVEVEEEEEEEKEEEEEEDDVTGKCLTRL